MVIFFSMVCTLCINIYQVWHCIKRLYGTSINWRWNLRHVISK
ncbi:hypothetical protein HanXRQr2_Chr15g0691331 [Helianthus annuus]|uniref:Uncharacterized protein n=1 Tax=Helianthus annuus TaxID=4232 RepID=A0A9K3DZX0_HELAN|nr:hypothetical protein HanXRQr2_Chr15g0691331 [Helianthus annuus]KAJ0831111.1 hypothetical protein HanPSC8_Chr15g0663231 [Helianthus annuus]